MTTLVRYAGNWVTAWRSLPIAHRCRILRVGLLILVVNWLLLVVTSEPLLIWFAHRFRSQDPLARSDAIVVLLGGPADRPALAAEIYRRGLAPIILMGRTRVVPYDETEAHRRALIQSGVPAYAIKILPGEVVESTRDEATRVRAYVQGHSVRRITVVTTAYHTARARRMFRKILNGTGVEIRMAASRDPRFSEEDWHACNIGIKTYILEAIKTCYYLFD